VTDARGQASLLLVGALLAVLLGAFVLGGVARGVGVEGEQQRAADLGALAGAQAMYEHYDRLFEPALVDGRPNARHLTVAAYLALGRSVAGDAATRNGAADVEVRFPDEDELAPVRIAVTARRRADVPGGGRVTVTARAEAELAPPSALPADARSGDEYRGPLAHRQGKPMRPDVARAFDRMEAAARRAGVALVIASGFRSNAEQAALFAQRPTRSGWRAGHVAAPLGHRARPRPAGRVRVARRERAAVRLQEALQLGALAFRLRAERRHAVGRLRARRRAQRDAVVRPRAVRGGDQPRGAALERRRRGARRAAVRRVELQPVRRSPAGRAGHRAVHAGHRARVRAARPVRPGAGDRRAGAPDARPAAQFGACRSRWPPTTRARAGAALRAASRPIPETRGYVARILGLLGGAGEAPAGGGLTVRLVR
jgi:hypothetical protein